MADFLMLGDDPGQNNTETLPLMSLREVVMFPRSIIPLFVGRASSVRAVEQALEKHNKKIFLVAQRVPEEESPKPEDLFSLGVVSKILQLLRLPDGTIKVLFEGMYRASWSRAEEVRADELLGGEPDTSGTSDTSDSPEEQKKDTPSFFMVQTSRIATVDTESANAEALVRTTHEALEKFGKSNKKIAQETIHAMLAQSDPGILADAIMPHLRADYTKKQDILEEVNTLKQLEQAFTLLQGEIEIASLEKKIKKRVKSQMEGNQKEYYLNEQMKAISKEMGREADPLVEVAEIEKLLEEKVMPDENRQKAQREIKKLKHIPQSSAEYTVVRNYVDWILDLPWEQYKATELDIAKAKNILENDHYGLDKPKERILEYLAVSSLTEKIKGPILCLVGPPGVGKTSLSKSVARAMDREFVRLSLGGVRDEAEVRGHRRTYIGALPGKIIQSLKRVKYSNPVFCLDEVDKMSTDFRGDPSAALLEVLDPEQNYSFNDHYLDMDYDLSKVFFITTANSLHSIPLPLRDRMEIITLPGYLETEKAKIAEKFLLPKQIKEHGLTDQQLSVSETAVLDIIRRYTREAGVRNLERELGTLCRKTAMDIVEKKDKKTRCRVTRKNLHNLLGVFKHRYGQREEEPLTGVATGLAYTELGGELLLVETALMPGTGKVEITGKLGEVMQESAKASLSYIRSRSDLFGLKPDFHKQIDIHVHVPEGATPKDGPSAGVTLTTSLVSAMLNLPVRNDLAMTGEITLRGRVLPIGGLREKLLAAHRGLVKTVLIPKENAKDLKEVPKSILKDLEILEMETLDEVLSTALTSPTGQADQTGQTGQTGLSPEAIFKGKGENFCPIAASLQKEEYSKSRH